MVSNVKKHRSMSDWTYGAWCSLSIAHFISPPTALANITGTECWADLDIALGENIPYGRVQFSIWTEIGQCTEIAFRIQQPPPWPLSTDYYMMHFWHFYAVTLYRMQGPVHTNLGEINIEWQPHEWQTFRIDWIRGCSPDANPSFTVELRWRQPSGYWLWLHSWTDHLNMWANSHINKFGFRMYSIGPPPFLRHWLDDLILDRLVFEPFPD